MRRRLLGAAVLVGLLSVSGTTAAPVSRAVRPFEATAVPHRIEAQLPPAGRNGNRDLLHWVIRDRHGHAFGTAVLDCHWYRDGYRLCDGMFQLARGSFAVIGASRGRDFGELLVLAGTGDYVGTRGSLTYNATRTGKLTLRGAF